MTFQKVVNLETNKVIQLGGNDASGAKNPTSIEGFYLGFREVDGDFGKTKLHVFQTAEGNIGVWGKSRMNSQLNSALLGTMLLVEFTGMIKPNKKGRKPSYGYQVSFDAAQKIDISTLNSESDVAVASYADDEEGYGNDGEDLPEETDPGEEERAPDEVPPSRAAAPRQAAQAPSAAAQQKVKDLLAGRRRQAQ